MKPIGKELKYLVLWLAASVLLVPPLFGWLGSLGLPLMPEMEAAAAETAYLHFFRHLHEPLMLIAVFIPYLMFVGARMLQERPARGLPLEVTEPAPPGAPATVRQLHAGKGREPQPDAVAIESSLHIAAMRGDTGLALVLLDKGVDFNAADHASGYTPLQIAALQGHAAVCETLIRYGASVDALTPRQETALHLAAQAGHAAAVATMLKYRANTGIRNSAGQTAQQLAQQHGHAGVVTLMEQHASHEWPYLRLANG